MRQTIMIHVSGISKQYGPRVLYKGGSFHINLGDRIGLVGPNGAGKTTVFRILTGQEKVDSGHVGISEKSVIGYFSQDVGEMPGAFRRGATRALSERENRALQRQESDKKYSISALEEVKSGAGRISELAAVLEKSEKRLELTTTNPLSDLEMEALLETYGEAQLEFEQRGGYDLDSRAKTVLTGLGIGPSDYDHPVETFSGGWKMRIALAKILALSPDLLLMDEPTNHLDLESIVWLEEWLLNFKGALFMTCHDRDFMNRLVTRIIEVANMSITSYSGNYDFYEREKNIRKEQLLASHRKQQDMLAKEEEFIARFAARASHAAQVQSRVKKLEKIDRIEIPPEEKSAKFQFPIPPRSGNDVVRLENLSKEWPLPDGKIKSVFHGVNGVVKRLDRIAVVGVNGAGKSTLLKCIAGLTEPITGTVTIGANIQMGYFSQHSLEILNPEKTIFDEIHDRISDATIGYVRNLLGAFLFSGDEVYKKISVLSGGEKSRVVLATILASPVNFLILDEPTNHLDIKTREILLTAIKEFDGTIMLVSHDRHFLRSIATRVFEVDHEELRVYEGGYEYYLDSTLAKK